jgi:hypothetical protein
MVSSAAAAVVVYVVFVRKQNITLHLINIIIALSLTTNIYKISEEKLESLRKIKINVFQFNRAHNCNSQLHQSQRAIKLNFCWKFSFFRHFCGESKYCIVSKNSLGPPDFWKFDLQIGFPNALHEL